MRWVLDTLFIIVCAILGIYFMPWPWLGGILGLLAALGLVEVVRWQEPRNPADSKIIDTSVIIDGRITDICMSKFISGSLIVPGFVLQELQRIADSADELKRNRGRRGLDTLAVLQRLPGIRVKIWSRDFPEVTGVDEKLLLLAKKLKAQLLTNDINLNKIAGLQGIAVLNINDLSNAVKTVVLPGEEMIVKIIKEGKEPGQGVGYLDDGTMVVVENGRPWLNQRLAVSVTSVLQTAAGRMIFAKIKAQGD